MTTSKFSLSAEYPANWPTVSTAAALGMSGAAAVAVVAAVALPLVRRLRGPAVPVHERGAILVTGASSGIGRDAAVTLSREEGITVLATVLNASEARQMKQASRRTKSGKLSSTVEPVSHTCPWMAYCQLLSAAYLHSEGVSVNTRATGGPPAGSFGAGCEEPRQCGQMHGPCQGRAEKS